MTCQWLANSRIAIPTMSIVLVLFAIWFITPASDLRRVPPRLMSGQEDAFQGLIAGHGRSAKATSKDLLRISAFMAPSIAHQYSVTSTGEEHDYRHCWDWAIQAQDVKQLSAPDLTELRSAISELPASSDDETPVERLVVISFWKGAKWTTRSYDSESLPEPMSRIFRIIHGAPSRMAELFDKWLKEHPEASNPPN